MAESRARLSRNFRFSLRGVLAAFTVVAVLLAVLSSPVRQAARQRQVIQEVQRLGGTIWFADELSHEQEQNGGFYQRHPQDGNRTWYERFGLDAYLRRVERINLDQQYDLPPKLVQSLANLPHLKCLSVSPFVARKAQIARLKQLNPRCVIVEDWYWGSAPVTTHYTQDSFIEAVARGKVVLFIDDETSYDQTMTAPVYFESYARWLVMYPESEVQFLRIHSHRSDWLMALHLQHNHGVDSEEIRRAAAGSLLWIRDGVLLRYDPSLRLTTLEEVIQHTEEAFETNESSAWKME